MEYVRRRTFRPALIESSDSVSPFAAPAPGLKDLRYVPVLVVLAERGCGKTTALKAEHQELLAEGLPSVFVNLGEDTIFDTTSAARCLTQVLNGARDAPAHFVFLDALDEAALDIQTLDRVLSGLLRALTSQDRARLRLRIACRTAHWPQRVEKALAEQWSERDMAMLTLNPFTRADVIAIAAHYELDGQRFLDQLRYWNVELLAQQPVTLFPLLDAYVHGEEFPRTAADALERSCAVLCAESWEETFARRGQRPTPTSRNLLAVARWVAAALQFGPYTVVTEESAGDASTGQLPLEDLVRPQAPAAAPELLCSMEELTQLTNSHLLAPAGPRRWAFAHRSYQEFLTAQFLQHADLDPLVVEELLWAGAGETRHIRPQHQEVAATLAAGNDTLVDDLLEHDPSVLLLGDLPAEQRARITPRLLERAAAHLDTLDGDQLRRLDHPQLAEQLAPYLTPEANADRQRLAVWIAGLCRPAGGTPHLLAYAEARRVPAWLRAFALNGSMP